MKYELLLVGLLALSLVSAVDVTDACSSRGFTSTDSVWTYNGTYFNEYGDVDVVGTARKFNWTSSTYIDGVVYKSGTRTYLVEGGYNGTIPKTTLSNDVSFVVFCKNDSVPEFGVIGATVAVVGALGLFLFRRR
ncbi:MAG: hypothetical protein ACP5OA_00205 [Candidatus Woesearchaeota archaeon]